MNIPRQKRLKVCLDFMKLNLDAQCDEMVWRSDSMRKGYADLIMGPLPAGVNQGDTMGPFPQQVTVRLLDYPEVPPV